MERKKFKKKHTRTGPFNTYQWDKYYKYLPIDSALIRISLQAKRRLTLTQFAKIIKSSKNGEAAGFGEIPSKLE